MTQNNFISSIASYVQKYAPQYNIKVCSPVIAQAILESASGTSELAKNAHNYFGLKYRAGRCPSACGIYNKIGSEQNKDGSYTPSNMQWAKFLTMEAGVQGYFDFINVPNYSNLKGITDPRIYLENIKKDGYATSLKYVDNLMAVITKYNLTQYDNLLTGGTKKVTYKVAIDAGHGSNTAGKRTPDGYCEHWVNVKCANYFNEAMKRCSIDTLKVAWDDTNAIDDIDVPLTTRQQQIKSAKCDISVSWHANAYGDGKSYNNGQGIETLIHNNSTKVKDSNSLAIKVQNNLIKGTNQRNRGVKTQNLAMCNCPALGTKASILIEIGFMTNEYEAGLIKSDAFCLECAEEAAQGVCEYLGVVYVKGGTITNNTNVNTTFSKTPTQSSQKFIYQGIDYSLIFNPIYYANKYPDLKKMFGTNATSLFNHFCTYGMKEGRMGCANFNVNKYKEYYADLRIVFGNNLPFYYKHYITNGYKEKRKSI